jgi:hypothetical protein
MWQWLCHIIDGQSGDQRRVGYVVVFADSYSGLKLPVGWDFYKNWE